jgi:hypothetical protein
MDLAQSWPYIEQIACHRLANNKTRRHVTKYGDYIEVIGAAGELAARRFLQFDENLHEHFDGGADILYKGIRIDVKATVWTPRLNHRYLQWPIWKPIKADAILFTAVNIEQKSAIVVGYALRHEINQAPVNNTRAFPCYEIPVPQLRKASRLLFAESRNDLYPSAKKSTYRGSQYYGAGT